jgi:hypothetical protein
MQIELDQILNGTQSRNDRVAMNPIQIESAAIELKGPNP